MSGERGMEWRGRGYAVRGWSDRGAWNGEKLRVGFGGGMDLGVVMPPW